METLLRCGLHAAAPQGSHACRAGANPPGTGIGHHPSQPMYRAMAWKQPIGFPLGRRPAAPETDAAKALARQESSKLEAVGQLAAGIAHEINTPIQFVGDSVRFLDQAFRDLLVLLVTYREALEDAPDDVREEIAAAEDAADLAYVQERVPLVFERVYGGVDRVSTLVRAMKSFAHSSPEGERGPADLDGALEATLTVAHNELKYVADVQVELGDLPAVVCNRSELNQAFLNLVVNAAHAIQDVVGDSGDKGVVRVTSRYVDNAVVIT